MKNVLCFIMFVCYSLWECGSSSGYFIDGVVEGMKEGRVFILKQNFMKDEFDTLTSAVVKDGKFTIRGSVRGPTVGLVGANGIMGSIVFLENNARYQFFLKVVGNPVIAGGGESQELYREFVAYDLKLTEELQKLTPEMIEVNRYGSDSAREVFQNKVDLLKMDNNRVKDEYLWKHLNTFFGVYELSLRAIDMDVTRVREAFALCGDELKKTDPGKYIRYLIPRLSKIAIGAPVPDFTAKTPEQEEISLYGIKAKFKLLDCWSSTCAMSRVEIKLIIPVYGKYKSRGFEILGLSFDKSYDKWVDMIRKDGSPWRQVSDLKGMQSPLADVYGVCELPSNLLLDENNKVIARNISGGQLDKMLSDYFMNK